MNNKEDKEQQVVIHKIPADVYTNLFRLQQTYRDNGTQ